MANNIVSDWLRAASHDRNTRVHTDLDTDAMCDYASKLDRLVEAAREAMPEIMPHSYEARDELTAALRDIELEKGVDELEQQLAAALERERGLIAWKDSMMSVAPPIQQIGYELGVEWGDTIHDKILPWIKASKERERLLRACVELLADEKNWAHTTADGPTVKAVVFAQKCLEELK